jgi:hypothetical protein
LIRTLALLLALMTPTDRYLTADAGCPRDQVENFLRAGIVLQPRQLAASAAARLCDREDGPTEIGYGGARGGGKSHWGIAQVFCDDCARFPGLKFLYLRKVGKAGKEAVQDLRRDVLHSTPHEYKANNVLTRSDNGSRVVLGPLPAREGHRQLPRPPVRRRPDRGGDPAQPARSATSGPASARASRLAAPEYSRPTRATSATPGSRRCSSPCGGAETDTRFIQATVRDNAFVNPSTAPSSTASPAGSAGWLDGDWDIAAGQFFTTFRRDTTSSRLDRCPRTGASGSASTTASATTRRLPAGPGRRRQRLRPSTSTPSGAGSPSGTPRRSGRCSPAGASTPTGSSDRRRLGRVRKERDGGTIADDYAARPDAHAGQRRPDQRRRRDPPPAGRPPTPTRRRPRRCSSHERCAPADRVPALAGARPAPARGRAQGRLRRRRPRRRRLLRRSIPLRPRSRGSGGTRTGRCARAS